MGSLYTVLLCETWDETSLSFGAQRIIADPFGQRICITHFMHPGDIAKRVSEVERVNELLGASLYAGSPTKECLYGSVCALRPGIDLKTLLS